MIRLLSIFTYISTIMAIIISLIVCTSFFGNKRSISSSDIHSQIGTCKTASVIFSILSWLVISGESKNECLKGYIALSNSCMKLGTIWIIYAFVCIAVSLLLNMKKKGTIKDLEAVSRFRNSGFVMSAIFWICSFILDVG